MTGTAPDSASASDTRRNSSDRILAIKRLKGQHSARLEQEARAIAALNHPHICQIYDVGPDYLVLEFIEGRPLKGLCRWKKRCGWRKKSPRLWRWRMAKAFCIGI